MHNQRLAVVFVVTLLAFCGGCGGSDSPVAPTASVAIDLSDMVGERTMGSASAPVTLIEYSSLTCPHCADFHATTFPQIKAQYIDTGKVRYIYRDFSRNDADVAAAQAARCVGSARYFDALDALYRAQSSWSSGNYYAGIKSVLSGMGVSSATLDACMVNSDLQAVVLQNRQAGVSAGVTGTPTFYINGTALIGAQPFDQFKALFDR